MQRIITQLQLCSASQHVSAYCFGFLARSCTVLGHCHLSHSFWPQQAVVFFKSLLQVKNHPPLLLFSLLSLTAVASPHPNVVGVNLHWPKSLAMRMETSLGLVCITRGQSNYTEMPLYLCVYRMLNYTHTHKKQKFTIFMTSTVQELSWIQIN